jgi:hypothetical protein
MSCPAKRADRSDRPRRPSSPSGTDRESSHPRVTCVACRRSTDARQPYLRQVSDAGFRSEERLVFVGRTSGKGLGAGFRSEVRLVFVGRTSGGFVRCGCVAGHPAGSALRRAARAGVPVAGGVLPHPARHRHRLDARGLGISGCGVPHRTPTDGGAGPTLTSRMVGPMPRVHTAQDTGGEARPAWEREAVTGKRGRRGDDRWGLRRRCGGPGSRCRRGVPRPRS